MVFLRQRKRVPNSAPGLEIRISTRVVAVWYGVEICVHYRLVALVNSLTLQVYFFGLGTWALR